MTDQEYRRWLFGQFDHFIARIERAYGDLPTTKFPGPPTNIIADMRAVQRTVLPTEPARCKHGNVTGGDWPCYECASELIEEAARGTALMKETL